MCVSQDGFEERNAAGYSASQKRNRCLKNVLTISPEFLRGARFMKGFNLPQTPRNRRLEVYVLEL